MVDLNKLVGKKIMIAKKLSDNQIDQILASNNEDRNSVKVYKDKESLFKNRQSYDTEMFRLDGYRDSNNLIMDLDITGLTKGKFKNDNGTDIHGSTNYLLDPEANSYLFQDSRRLVELTRLSDKSNKLDFKVNNTPLIIKKGFVLLEIDSVIEATSVGGTQKLSIKVLDTIARWKLEIGSPGQPEVGYNPDNDFTKDTAPVSNKSTQTETAQETVNATVPETNSDEEEF